MNIIFAIALVLSVIAVYMLVIEVFSVAFKLTGLTTKKTKFQVASIFTGTGFTTAESELIVTNIRRRRIATICMYTSHIFSVVIMGLLINFVISLVSSITNKEAITAKTFTEWYAYVFYVSLFLFLLVLFLKIPPINRKFLNFLEKLALKLSRSNRKNNIVTVIDMYGKNAVAEIFLNNVPEFAKDVPLSEMHLNKKFSINILVIKRGTRTIAVSKDTMFAKGDVIIVFGLLKDIEEAFIDNEERQEKTVSAADQNTNVLSLMNNYGPNVLMEIEVQEVPKEIEGLSMKDAHLTDKYNINITIIKRKDDYIFVSKDTVIQKGDKITIFGPYKNIKHLFSNEEEKRTL